jgi:hypothetical protein
MNSDTTPPLDLLMTASLYLMTRYAEEKRPETAVALAQCLEWIACTRNARARSWPGRPHTSRRNGTVSRA